MRKNAFTLIEVLTTLVLMASLALMMYPMLVTTEGTSKLVAGVKDVVNQLTSSCSNIAVSQNTPQNDPVCAASAQQLALGLGGIGGLSNVQKETGGNASALDTATHTSCTINSQCIQVASVTIPPADNPSSDANCAAGTTCVLACTTDTPCLVMHNGGLLMYISDTNGGSVTPDTFPSPTVINQSAVRFLYDPDGNGPEPATMLVLFQKPIRTTTYFSAISWPSPYTMGSSGPTFNVVEHTYFPTINADPAYLDSWIGS
jgi:prepilin-type N-terminal cleavage/methylation domain-containing protein